MLLDCPGTVWRPKMSTITDNPPAPLQHGVYLSAALTSEFPSWRSVKYRIIKSAAPLNNHFFKSGCPVNVVAFA